MNKPFRFFLFAALLAPAIAPAQTTTTTVLGVPASLEVSRLAPQLVTFLGSQANFDSLVNGLALGTPVTLSTTLPTGQVQITSFTPQGTMTPTQIAQTLEGARQGLISRGIATPNGQQLAISLTGGTLPTQAGNVPVTGVLPATSQPVQAAAGATGPASAVTTTTTVANPNGSPSPAALLQGQSSAGGTTPPSPAAVIQNQREGNISNTPIPGNVSNTPSTSTPTATTGTTGTSTAAPLAPTPTAPASPFAPPVR